MLAASSAHAAKVVPRRVATAEANEAARPDTGLYREAQAALATLEASRRRQAERTEWERVILRFRRVVARYPQSGYCDDALLAVGDLYRKMAVRFKAPRYEDDAVQAYRMLVAEYPSSRRAEPALFAVVELARDGGRRHDLTQAGREYLAAFPDSARAALVKKLLKRSSPAQEVSLPSPPPRKGLAQVFNLRFWSGDSSTRVVLDVEKEVEIHHDRIRDPDRLWIDLEGTRLHPNLAERTFPVGDGLLEKVRIGQNRDAVVRVVLDFKDVKDHKVFYLANPIRLVIDVQGTPRPQMASTSRPSEAAATPAPRAATPDPIEPPDLPPVPPAPMVQKLPVRRVAAVVPPPTPSPSPAARESEPITLDGGRPSASSKPGSGRLSAWTPHVAVPSPAPTPSAPPSVTRAVSRAPEPPLVNRAGSYSLARQLGLGARRIVIDAGHGGHDPGTIGRGGLQEKDLVLDVAQRVERLVRQELGAEVVMTRPSDVFVPLEERTAIANSRGADLFLSIHANSSRNSGARGVETYFLNFAQDPHAEAVAARENAISPATLKDLQNLVKAITLNSKIDESRDFAASVQESMIDYMRPISPQIQDRGIRTAPFYVLIGANMPSILAEIAFVSNPEDERLLRTPEHRERIAYGLFEGVRAYLDTLNRGQAGKITGIMGQEAAPSRPAGRRAQRRR